VTAAAPKKILRVLTGCTAVGKTEWSLRWAEAHGAEIISCDSLLFYRGMDIGTAKPTAAERERVRHHLIDICEPSERMDITRYVSLARAALEDIEHRGRTPLVVGGSGFYLKAFFAPVADDLSVPDAIRQEVGTLPLKAAVERLRTLNPEGLENIDLANPRRVTRALERCLASGETLAQLKRRFAQMPGPFADRKIIATRIDRSPPELEGRIADRVDQMLQNGLVDEVQRLLQAGLRENPSASKAIGYREVIDCIDGRLPKAQLASEIVKNTRALVKKQRTWFRTQLPAGCVLDANEIRNASQLFE
jgi:tRNA dimethylallyltransferase